MRRSYTAVVINRSTGAILSKKSYDVYGAGQLAWDGASNTAATLAADLNALTSDKLVVVISGDEPMTNRLTSGLDAAMYRCGASRAVFGSSNFKSRSAYVLIGIPGCGEGNGAEAYQGEITNDPNAWVDVSFSLIGGALSGVSAHYVPKTLSDYGYVGALDATKGATLGPGGNVTGKATNTTDLSNNLGTYTSPGTARTQISDLGVRIYDGGNNLLIKMGVL